MEANQIFIFILFIFSILQINYNDFKNDILN